MWPHLYGIINSTLLIHNTTTNYKTKKNDNIPQKEE